MQYHLNGFRPGDPDIHPAATAASSPPPATVDVLIVGCGPAGLTLAAQLASFAEITTRIIDAKPGPMEKGQADGVSCRSMEMFQAFGFAHKILREAYWVNETSFWRPDANDPTRITRSGRVRDVEEGLSEMPHVILNQARVHELYLDRMRNAPTRLVAQYGTRFAGLSIDEAAGSHPITVTLENAETGTAETLRAAYVVGCDGARSAVRRAIGRELRGESANQAWGVMDVLVDTDFPDIRLKSLVQSQEAGTALIIPREGGHLVRFYIEQDKLAPGERASDRNITLDQLFDRAQRIFAPYRLELRDVVWWSVYQIGQRLTDRFDNLPDDAGPEAVPRVFIAGDACHTHSPKAGQGMNVSMGDTFNLGWKLAAVLRGAARPALLRSYSEERQGVAQDLIDFDREWARIISARDAEGGDTPGFQKQFIRQGRYTAGVAVQYAPSLITGPARWQERASGFEIGTRLHSSPVIRLADAKPMHLGHVVEADGRWRLFAFAPANDPTAPNGALAQLCDWLQRDAASPLLRHTPPDQDIDAAIDLRAVLPQGHQEVELPALHPLLRPTKGQFALTDHEKVFCADPAEDIFERRGIDRAKGALLILRPDQYVAHILPLDETGALADFFAEIMTEARPC